MLNTWNLTETLLLKGRLEIQILDLKSKILFISTVGIKSDIIENDENFKNCSNPFFENLENIEIFLLPSSEFSNFESYLSFNLSLSSYSMDFENYFFQQQKDKKICLKILKKIHSHSNIENIKNLSELQLNYIGRIKNNKNFMKILQENLLIEEEEEEEEDQEERENLKKYSKEILENLNFLQKNESYKFELISNPEEEIEIKNEKELKIEESNEIEDLKELEMYEKNGIDKFAVNKDEYILNLIRIILTYKNNLQAKKFCEKNLTAKMKIINSDDFGEKLTKSIELYNKIIIIKQEMTGKN